MLRCLGTAIAFAMLFASGTQDGRIAPAVSPSQMALLPCTGGATPAGALCGSLTVFENRATRAGRTIALSVLVLPARTSVREPDPVFWLEGGPGGSAIASAGPVGLAYLKDLRDTRDLVFVDTRGTGKSQALKCGDIGENPDNLDGYFGKLFPLAAIRQCRQSLEAIADLTQYTTSIAMEDVDDVRRALGYERINLAGTSYGTLSAQVYMRAHPDRVRAAFLVGVVTPDFRLPLPFAKATEHAWARAREDCAAEPACAAAFPDLAREFDAVLARFDRGPIVVEMVDPLTQAHRPVTLERENYVEHLRAMLYSTAGARFVPLVVHRAFLQDFLPFQTMATRYNLGGPGTSRGLYFSTTCAESAPFITDADIVAATRGTFLGDRRVRAHLDACTEWPRGRVSPDFIQPLRSEIPVIFFSGEADGSTPSWIATSVVGQLSRGRQIVAPHTGHQVDSPCTSGLMQTFLRAPAAALDATCAQTLKRPAFATDLAR